MTAFKRYTGLDRTTPFPSVVIPDRDTDLFVSYNIEDRLEIVAHRVYGDASLWWIIMLANPEYAMEYDIEPGETIRVPMPLNAVITDIRNQVR